MKGRVLLETENIFNKLAIVKKTLKANEKIPSHNHEGEKIFFTVIKGSIKVFLNDTEEYNLNTGDILHFDGENFISAEAVEDTTVYVYLLKED